MLAFTQGNSAATKEASGSANVDDSLAFIAEWFDKMACVNKRFRIIFYPVDNSVEIIDLKTRKQHLKRIHFADLTQQDLFVGNTFDIYGRRYKIVEFADKFTKENMS